MIYLLYLAGFVLAMIILANFIAPGMLNYGGNLAKVETFFGQVFQVHCAYTVSVMLGMLLLCVCVPNELLTGRPLAVGLTGFLALFWLSRVVVQLVYYEEAMKRRYPIFNLMFLSAFTYLGALFAVLFLQNL